MTQKCRVILIVLSQVGEYIMWAGGGVVLLD